MRSMHQEPEAACIGASLRPLPVPDLEIGARRGPLRGSFAAFVVGFEADGRRV